MRAIGLKQAVTGFCRLISLPEFLLRLPVCDARASFISIAANTSGALD